MAIEVDLRGAMAIPASMGQMSLWFLLPLRLTMAGETVNAGGLTVSSSAFGIAIVPSLQITTPLFPQVRGYGAFGFGPAHFRVRTEVPYIGYVSANTTVMEFDLTAGFDYGISDRYALFFEPMGLRIFTAEGSSALWSMLVGVRMDL